MQTSHRISVLSSAAVAAVVALSTASPAQAAPVGYEAEVNNNNPYVYYRLQETGTLTNANAADSSLNNRAPGVYRGNPVGGIPGNGAASDTAVSFPAASVSGLDYLRTTDTLAFGSQVGQSSYELVFKTNTINPTNYQSIFGVFNQSDSTTTPPRTNTGAVAIEFNSTSTGNATTAGTSRFYVRDENNRAIAGVIDNGSLLNGEYHHLVFTYDFTAASTEYIKAYVDGVSVPVSLVPQGIGAPTAADAVFLPFNRDPVFGARNVRGTVGNEANVTIDEAALYGNTVLTAGQVAENATAAGFVVIPEPGSLALAGIAGLGLLARRRRQA